MSLLSIHWEKYELPWRRKSSASLKKDAIFTRNRAILYQETRNRVKKKYGRREGPFASSILFYGAISHQERVWKSMGEVMRIRVTSASKLTRFRVPLIKYGANKESLTFLTRMVPCPYMAESLWVVQFFSTGCLSKISFLFYFSMQIKRKSKGVLSSNAL